MDENGPFSSLMVILQFAMLVYQRVPAGNVTVCEMEKHHFE